MKLKEIKRIIKIDKKRNTHPKNRAFIYIFRLGQYFYFNKNKNKIFKFNFYLARIFMKTFINKNNHIPLETIIKEGIKFPHFIGIIISGHAKIGSNCTILHGVTIGTDDFKDSLKAPVIGNNVFLGAGCKIIGNVKIGDNTKVGANAVITKNVPENCTVVGFNKIII